MAEESRRRLEAEIQGPQPDRPQARRSPGAHPGPGGRIRED